MLFQCGFEDLDGDGDDLVADVVPIEDADFVMRHNRLVLSVKVRTRRDPAGGPLCGWRRLCLEAPRAGWDSRPRVHHSTQNRKKSREKICESD